MQSASGSMTNKLQQSHDINSSISVIAEWNYNRFATVKSVVNTRLIGSATLTDSSNTIRTSAAHGLAVQDRIQLGAVTGTTNVLAGTTYWVLTVPTVTSMTIAASFGGAVINISTNGTSPSIYEVVEDYDEEIFPIESLVLPDRPTTRGNLKARASTRAGVIGAGADSWTNNGYEDTPNGARYSTADVNTKYKYWSSPFQSAGSYAMSAAAISQCSPSVTYTTAKSCNKVLVSFESSYTQPSIYTIQITTDGTTWSTIATTPTIPASGRVELYRQSNGTWSSTPYRDNPQNILGLKVNVTQMSKSQVFCSIIELSLRLEVDLSAYVTGVDVSNTMSETSFVTPLGTASANTGTVSLANTDGLFTNDNPSSPYFGLLDKNVELRISEGTNIATYAAPNFEWIRIATMRSSAWSGQTRDTTSISLSDDYVRLQEIKPNAVFYQSMTVGEIIWRLLDAVGFVNYKYEARDDDPATIVPFFWTDGTKTLADIINELAQATQTAVFFDEYNILQILTRESAYDLLKTPTWTFNAVPDGVILPDIVEADKTYDFEANVVNTSYVETKLSNVSASGIPVMEKVWEPESDVVLRSASLMTNMTTTSVSARFTPTHMSSWPFTGIIQVEGEFMRYTHKGYAYYSATNVLTNTWVASNDAKIALDKKNPGLAYKNYYNGYLNFGLANRGLWSSVPKAHVVDIAGWAGRWRTLGGSVNSWMGGILHNKTNGIMRVATNKGFGPNSWYAVLTGYTTDAAPVHYGTRLRFPVNGYSGSGGMAGMVIGATTNDAGYYIELNRTAAVDRKWTNELCFYVKYADGHINRIAGKGIAMSIETNTWIDMDVTVRGLSGGRLSFSISVNGVIKWNIIVELAQRCSPPPMGGHWGLFVRNWTWVDFEYAYASVNGLGDAADDEGYFDRIGGGYMGTQLMQQFVYSTRKTSRIVKKKRKVYYQKYNQTTIDEFGPVAHEVREFDVKFSKAPVLNSNLYFSNENQVICPEYNSDPFGAKFVIANTARVSAIVKGEDTLTFGANNPVNQQMIIYGRTVTPAEAKIVTVKDEAGIRKRGEVAVDISSPWIQSEAAARTIGNWITLHWSSGADEVEMTVFGNPLLQLGDVVAVNYPLMNMESSTHKYFLVKINQTYGAGLSTKLVLRRVTSKTPPGLPA